MRRLLLAVVVGSFASLVACTIQNPPPDNGGSSSGGTTSSGGSSPSTPSNPEGGTTQNNEVPAPSQTAAEVDIDGSCSAFAACGGNPQGTYDYTGGCIEDVFAGARGACPALDTTKATVKVKGSITFAGNALTRDVTVMIGGSLTLPESCTAGQCAAIEAELKNAFDSVSCTGTGACTCTISNTENEKDATTYTIQGSLVTTADGDQYSICEKSADLSYSGKSVGSEQGTFTLKKR
jgi:hypothetical protein